MTRAQGDFIMLYAHPYMPEQLPAGALVTLAHRPEYGNTARVVSIDGRRLVDGIVFVGREDVDPVSACVACDSACPHPAGYSDGLGSSCVDAGPVCQACMLESCDRGIS